MFTTVPVRAFARRLSLPGWSPRSSWGRDPLLECFWLELVPEDGGPSVRIGPEHLVATVDGLARVLASALVLEEGTAYLALTA